MSECTKTVCRFQSTPGHSGNRELTWGDVARLYADPEQCLASYLAMWGAEVLSAVKPANLIRINNRQLACGRNMYRLWSDFGESFLADSPLQARALEDSSSGILLLLYRPELLERRLATRTMRVFLRACGYPQALTLDAALNHLQSRYREAVPDEIGMFLGYPLKDVKGFICKRSQPWRGRSLWRIYGPAKRSLRLHELYRQARIDTIARLVGQTAPLQILQVA